MKRPVHFLAFMLIAAAASFAVTVKEVPSRFIKSPGKISVSVPDGYDKGDQKDYPVLYLLNGHGGNHTSWPGIINTDSLATVYKMIIVCPQGRNSWYWDSPVDSNMQMESYITKELVPWIDKNYRTRRCPGQRAITGLSMGGHGGLWLGLRHPELFRNAGATSGGVDIRPFPTRWNMADFLGPKDKYPERWENHTVTTLIEKVNPEGYGIIFDCGTEDFFYKVNCKLDSIMTAKGIEHTFLTSPGSHNGKYWRKSIIPQIKFFHHRFYPQESKSK